MAKIVTETMAVTPTASPSSPSNKFTAFVTPTSQRIVRGREKTPKGDRLGKWQDQIVDLQSGRDHDARRKHLDDELSEGSDSPDIVVDAEAMINNRLRTIPPRFIGD